MPDVSEAIYKILKDKNNIGRRFIFLRKFISIMKLVKIIKEIMKEKKNYILYKREIRKGFKIYA